jgi:Domain of unknown function (DUF4440)
MKLKTALVIALANLLLLIVVVFAVCETESHAQTAQTPAIQQVRQVAQDFRQALADSNKTALADLLDDDFQWTDTSGKMLAKSDFLQGITQPAAANAPNPQISDLLERVYGGVAVVRGSRGKTQIGQVWVKRASRWRLLTYDETTLVDQAEAVKSSGVSECENPCKTLPFTPKNDSERGIIASWQALETAVTHHDSAAWAPHIADEFISVNANNDHPLTKSDRMAILDKQQQTGAGAAPVPLVSATMFDFDDAVVMTAQHQRGSSKPIHVTRVWIKRDGQWLMAFSQQTTIQ